MTVIKKTQDAGQDDFNAEAYVSDLGNTLTTEIYRILSSINDEFGGELCSGMANQLITDLVSMYLVGSLIAKPANIKSPSKKQIEEYVVANYRQAKTNIQDAVADGFENAMRMHSGVNMEYFCDVTPIPEPMNEKEI